MSYKSSLSNTGSCRQNSLHEKLHSTPSEEKIKFAGDESKDRLYEPKQNKKMVRVLTVVIYIFSVSLAAIMLSLYYVFFWNPHYATSQKPVPRHTDNVTTTSTSTTTTTSTTTAIPSYHDGDINKVNDSDITNLLINTTDITTNIAYAVVPDLFMIFVSYLLVKILNEHRK